MIQWVASLKGKFTPGVKPRCACDAADTRLQCLLHDYSHRKWSQQAMYVFNPQKFIWRVITMTSQQLPFLVPSLWSFVVLRSYMGGYLHTSLSVASWWDLRNGMMCVIPAKERKELSSCRGKWARDWLPPRILKWSLVLKNHWTGDQTGHASEISSMACLVLQLVGTHLLKICRGDWKPRSFACAAQLLAWTCLYTAPG